MKGGKLIGLALAAIALGIVAIIAYKQDHSTADKGVTGGRTRGEQLLPELGKRAGDIASIEVATPKSSDSLKLARDENNDWTVASNGGYPADVSKPGRLLVDLTDIKVGGRMTDNPEKYANFGFTDEMGDKCAVTFKDKAGKLVTRVIFGGERKAGEEESAAPMMGGGRYVRVSGDPYVYLAQENLYWVDTSIINWVNTEIMTLPQPDVISVSVNHATTESFTVNWEKGTAEIDNPDGRKIKDNEIDNVRGALGGLRLTNVIPANSAQATSLTMENSVAYTARAKDGVIYTAQLGQAGDKRTIRLSASVGEPFYAKEDQATTPALASAQEKAGKNKETAEAFNKRHAPWLYEVDTWNYDKLSKKRSAVTEPLTEPIEAKMEGKPTEGGDHPTSKPKTIGSKEAPKPVRSDDKKTTKTLTKDSKAPTPPPKTPSSASKAAPAKPEIKPVKPEVKSSKPEEKKAAPTPKPAGGGGQ